MARKPESTFILSVHKHLPPSLYKMKNHNAYVGGPADNWYSGMTGDLWIEYKFLPRIPREFVTVALSELQRQWLHNRYHEGRNVAVVVGCKDGGVILRNLRWENPISSLEFTTQIQGRRDIAAWIQSETGDSHDQERSRDIPNTRRTASSSRRQAPDMRRSV